MKYNCSTVFPPNVCDYPERVLHTFCALARALPAKEYKALRWGLKPQKIPSQWPAPPLAGLDVSTAISAARHSLNPENTRLTCQPTQL